MKFIKSISLPYNFELLPAVQIVTKIRESLTADHPIYGVVDWPGLMTELHRTSASDTKSHAVVLEKLVDHGNSVRIQNSWGPEWGENGFLTIPFNVLMRHLDKIEEY